MVAASGHQAGGRGKVLDFFRNNGFFERSGPLSRAKMNALARGAPVLGDVRWPGKVERFMLPGVAEVSD